MLLPIAGTPMDAAEKSVVIAYHADCIDGAASAWAVTESLPRHNISYVPYSHASHAESEEKVLRALGENATLYFVDVAPEKEFLDGLCLHANVAAVHIMDHHKTAQETLAGYTKPAGSSTALTIAIDQNKPSAALMVWKKALPNRSAPDVLSVIDKMDGDASGLKTHDDFAAAALIDTSDVRTIGAAMNSLRGLAKMSFNQMAAKGMPTLRDQENRIDALLAGASGVDVQILPDTAPVTIPVVNGNVRHFGRMISERLVKLGRETGAGVAFSFAVEKNGSVSMSIRTDKATDASKVAEHLCRKFGLSGGGHAGAAAVSFPSLEAFARLMPLKPLAAK